MTADRGNLDPRHPLDPVDQSPCSICGHTGPHFVGFDNMQCEHRTCTCPGRDWPPLHDDTNLLAEYADEIARLRDVLHRVRLIDPADHATASRDYGRGFAEALRLVRRELDA